MSEPMRLAILTLLLLFASLSGVAAQQEGDPQKGAAYAKQNCANCHAIANEKASPVPTAPCFKRLASTSSMTAMALMVWLQTSHPTMPNIIIEPNAIRNVVAYILSLRN
jgi:mono/diheme cytochrome c family protein